MLAADHRSSDTVMLGSDRPIRMDFARVREAYALPGVSEELERANLYGPLDIFARSLLASRDEVMQYTMLESRRVGTEWEEHPGSTNQTRCEAPSCRREPAILNTDDNARIEFAAPRDLISFYQYEGYLRTIYSQDWPYGNPLDAEIRGAPLLSGFGEGAEAARSFAELGISMMAHGRVEWASSVLEHGQRLGNAREIRVAIEVLTHLSRSDTEPTIEIEPPVPGPEMDRSTARQLTQGFESVRRSIDEGAFSAAYAAMERIPNPLRLHSGPSMRFLYGYLLYKAADGHGTHYSSAVGILQDLIASEPDYVMRHPEVYYFLARSHEAQGEDSHAVRAMRAYVEASLDPVARSEDLAEPPPDQAVESDAPGESDKTEHPDQG